MWRQKLIIITLVAPSFLLSTFILIRDLQVPLCSALICHLIYHQRSHTPATESHSSFCFIWWEVFRARADLIRFQSVNWLTFLTRVRHSNLCSKTGNDGNYTSFNWILNLATQNATEGMNIITVYNRINIKAMNLFLKRWLSAVCNCHKLHH